MPQSSGAFYLAGGTIPPKTQNGGSLTISVSSLPRNVHLDINCDIENPNYYKPYAVVISAYGSINGITSLSYQYLLDHQISKFNRQLVIDGSTPNGNPSYISFTNYDDSEAVYIKNCVVTYTTI
jgi:hypothetical protein